MPRGWPFAQARLALALAHPIFGIFRDMINGSKRIIVRPDGSPVEVIGGQLQVLEQVDAPSRVSRDFEMAVVEMCTVCPSKLWSVLGSKGLQLLGIWVR